LLPQFEKREENNQQRLALWNNYFEAFGDLEKRGLVGRPNIPEYAKHNGHTFYLVARSMEQRNDMISFVGKLGVQANFHFQSLHKSKFYTDKYDQVELPNADRFSNCLLRLPMFNGLEPMQNEVIEAVVRFYQI
jgi:dTDP-4-amino-4,6-dideoxygalactose transaminase